jgi:hypothetical protein
VYQGTVQVLRVVETGGAGRDVKLRHVLAANTLLVFATPKFSSLAIRKAWELDWHPLHFVGQPGSAIESVIRPAGVEKAVGLVTAQLLKDPGDPAFANDAEVVEYNRFMVGWAPGDNAKDTGAISGYVTAQGIELVLRRCGGLRHGFFECSVACEIVSGSKRQLVIRAGKSHKFTIPEEELRR